MDIGALLFFLGLLGLVAAFVGRPLLEKRGSIVTDEDIELSSLQAQRDHVLDLLDELEMDRSMGKIDQEDYQRRRADLLSEGAEVLQELDALSPAPDRSGEPASDPIERAIEARVQQLRQQRSGEQGARYCPACGTEAHPSDQFCTQCGEPLAEEAGA